MVDGLRACPKQDKGCHWSSKMTWKCIGSHHVPVKVCLRERSGVRRQTCKPLYRDSRNLDSFIRGKFIQRLLIMERKLGVFIDCS
jgi:hypothetical protein